MFQNGVLTGMILFTIGSLLKMIQKVRKKVNSEFSEAVHGEIRQYSSEPLSEDGVFRKEK